MTATNLAHQNGTAARRRATANEPLSGEAIRWLTALPGELRPRHLPIECAHIANELSRCWSMPSKCIGYLEELLIDTRGNRAGLAMDVALELAYLKNYYETSVHPTSQTVWDEIIARRKTGQ